MISGRFLKAFFLLGVALSLLKGGNSAFAQNSEKDPLSNLPPDKQAIERRYAEERAAGERNPAPRNPNAPYPSFPAEPFPEGIFDQEDAIGYSGVSICNRWQGVIGSSEVVVYAGVSLSKKEGVAIIRRDDGSPVLFREIRVSSASERLCITAAKKGIMTLTSENKSGTFKLNAITGEVVPVR